MNTRRHTGKHGKRFFAGVRVSGGPYVAGIASGAVRLMAHWLRIGSCSVTQWGEKFAEEILPNQANCSDCEQLWREYADVTKRNVVLLLQEHRADGRDLQCASEARNSLRQYLREH